MEESDDYNVKIHNGSNDKLTSRHKKETFTVYD
jgi:hypothetical protein